MADDSSAGIRKTLWERPSGGGAVASSYESGSGDEAVFVYDKLGKCRWVNPAGERLLRLAAGEIIGRDVGELFPEQPWSHVDAWRRVAEARDSSSFDWRVPLAEGTGALQMDLFPVMDREGQVQSIVGLGRRIAEAEDLEHQLQGAEPALIHEIASIMSSSLDVSEVYERFAAEFKRLVDFDRIVITELDEEKELVVAVLTSSGPTIGEIPMGPFPLAGSGMEWLIQHGRTHIEDDLSRHREFAFDGAVAAAGIRSMMRVPLVTRNGVVGLVGLGSRRPKAFGERERAVAERMVAQIAPAIDNARLYAEVQQALETLRATQHQMVRVERLRAMGELASGVAHDFNNALAGILGQTQLLLNQVTNESQRGSLRLIEQAALDSAQVVRRILDFARLDSDTEMSAVDVPRLLENVVELTRYKWSDEAQSTGRTIQVTTRAADVPPALGNYAELREVLTNLVINACEAIPRHGAIDMSAGASEEHVHISVSDTGVGMSPEVMRKVFDPFFTTKGSSGTGLGLSLSFGIISRHNGTIDVESEEGVGTTVRVSLPVAPFAEQPEEGETSALAEGHNSADILVVEDDSLIRETMADVLALAGHRVVLAKDGEDGLSRFEERAYDLVFTDLGMPGLSGWDVARAMKRRRPEVPVIMVTGWGVSVDQSEVERSGIEGVLAKPFQIDDLLDLARSFVAADAEGPEG